MSKKSVLKASALAVAIAATAAPVTAAAEISGSLDIASQYLWRGQSLFGGGTISGSLDAGHESGLYAGIWTSSESGKTEYDLYAGFAGEQGGLSYDVAYIDYNYSGGDPACGGADADSCDFQEIYVGLGFAGVGLDAYLGTGDYSHGSEAAPNDDNYYAISYGIDKIGATVGYYDFDAADSDYTHLDLSYALTDQFTFTASKIVDEELEDSTEDDVKFVVSYSFAL